MSERENIFARIREALKDPAPKPGHHHGHAAHETAAAHAPAPTARNWLPPVGETLESQIELFRVNAADLKADFLLVESQTEAVEALQKLAGAEAWKKFAAHEGELTNKVCSGLRLPRLSTSKGYDVNELESCDAGITECDALIAQTGSVLITSRSAGGRALSVLPPHHVVLARRSQMLADLPAAFELLQRKYAGDYPSLISLVTGPSRTGDIERILVLGAHGPKKLTIICLNS